MKINFLDAHALGNLKAVSIAWNNNKTSVYLHAEKICVYKMSGPIGGMRRMHKFDCPPPYPGIIKHSYHTRSPGLT